MRTLPMRQRAPVRVTGACDWCGSPHVCGDLACAGTERHCCAACRWAITPPWPAVFVLDALELRRRTGAWCTVDAVAWSWGSQATWAKHPSIAQIKLIPYKGPVRSDPRDHSWPSRRADHREWKRIGVHLRRRRSDRLWRRELDLTPVSCEDDEP